MSPEELIKLADLFSQEAEKGKQRIQYAPLPKGNLAVLDRVNKIISQLNKIKYSIQHGSIEIGWWKKLLMSGSLGGIEDEVDDLLSDINKYDIKK
jgi:hypothetical protein